MNRILRQNKELKLLAEKELKNIASSEQSLKLKAIIALDTNPVSVVAQVFGCTANTLRSWVKRFAEEQLAGLVNKPRRARRPKLDEEARKEVFSWLEDTSQQWTLLKLQIKIRERLGVRISLNAIWKMLKKHNYSHITARPVHHKQNPQDIKTFKKKLQ